MRSCDYVLKDDNSGCGHYYLLCSFVSIWMKDAVIHLTPFSSWRERERERERDDKEDKEIRKSLTLVQVISQRSESVRNMPVSSRLLFRARLLGGDTGFLGDDVASGDVDKDLPMTRFKVQLHHKPRLMREVREGKL